jgi:hypothetical protein
MYKHDFRDFVVQTAMQMTVAYLRPVARIFVIFLSTYSIFEAVWKKKKLKGTVPGGAK